MAVSAADQDNLALIAVLEDIFVAVAFLTITVGLVLPGMIAHATTQVADTARRLRKGTLADLTGAMDALGRGDLEHARARPDTQHVAISSRDEVGMMAGEFNTMQDEVARAAVSLDGAREELRRSRRDMEYLATHDPLTGLPKIMSRRWAESAL